MQRGLLLPESDSHPYKVRSNLTPDSVTGRCRASVEQLSIRIVLRVAFRFFPLQCKVCIFLCIFLCHHLCKPHRLPHERKVVYAKISLNCLPKTSRPALRIAPGVSTFPSDPSTRYHYGNLFLLISSPESLSKQFFRKQLIFSTKFGAQSLASKFGVQTSL